LANRTTTGRYEMLWDCPACGTAGLLGLTHRFCPTCGSPQDPARRYFPPDDQKIAVEDHPYQGADVICGGCDTPNAAQAGFCVSCGAPLEGNKVAGVRAEQAAGGADDASAAAKEHAARRQAERDAASRAHAVASGAAPPAGAGKKAAFGMFGAVAIGGVCLLVCAGILAMLFWKREAGVTVTGHSWARSIEVMELRTESASGWKDEVPADAAGVSCAKEQRDTKQVPDGETCVNKRVDKGDGSFDTVKDCSPKYREEPVFDDKCSYTVDRWRKADEVRTAGAALTPAPAWPAEPAPTGSGRGARKPGDRHETYTVAFADGEGKAYTCDVAEPRWTTLGDGTRWKGSVSVVTGALDCDALEPAH
jgi:hypothetical protein